MTMLAGRNLIQGAPCLIKVRGRINMGSPRTHQGITVHEETIGVDLCHGLGDLVRITMEMRLTRLEWVGEINDLHMTIIG